MAGSPARSGAQPQGSARVSSADQNERPFEGIALSKKRGAYDRTPNLTQEQIEEARQRIEAKIPKVVIARDLGVSRTTLYAALAGEGRYTRSAA
ncbi:MAG TPA: helix-turn-helix domain-containing protein [Protaetiibacter sp.]|nr:helix-turn-helix domain-containing protein [Protaetiibacter sp.]